VPSNVQRERETLAAHLRELRVGAGLTGAQLAAAAQWPPSKVSKIEHSKQTPTLDDLGVWTEICDAQDHLEQLRHQLVSLDTFYSEWRRQQRAGMQVRQRGAVELDARTSVMWIFEPVCIPGPFQTEAYARERLTVNARLHGSPGGIEEAVALRVGRRAMFDEPGRAFHIVITETVLRLGLAAPAVMAEQLEHLALVCRRPQIQFGVVPLHARVTVTPAHGFWIYDDELVIVETLSGELRLTQPPEIGLYARLFERLAAAAVYDTDALALIARCAADWRSPA
jgi:hypothetical protein